MEKIYMQYPLDETGVIELNDGNTHEIEPQSFIKITIGDVVFYAMDYLDVDFNINTTTLLTVIGNELVNVPLNSYDSLYDYLENNKLESINANEMELPLNIKLGETIDAYYLFENANFFDKLESFIITKNIYVPINKEGETSAIGTLFTEGGCGYVDDESEKLVYTFMKEPEDDRIIEEVEKGIKNPVDENEENKYSFELDMSNGDFGTKLLALDTEEVGYMNYLYLPCHHVYNVTYSEFENIEDYIAAKKASIIDIEVDGTSEEFTNGFTDSPKAFAKIGTAKDKAKFFDADCQEIKRNYKTK